MYADASGKDEWAVRGPNIFPTIWRLIRIDSNSPKRLLDTGKETLELIPIDDGFTLSNHSS